jgi:hypothetical protein
MEVDHFGSIVIVSGPLLIRQVWVSAPNRYPQNLKNIDLFNDISLITTLFCLM